MFGGREGTGVMPFGSQNSTDGLGIQAPAHERFYVRRAPLGRFILLVRHEPLDPPACVESQVRESGGCRSAAGTIAGQVQATSRVAIPLMGREMTRSREPKRRGPQRGQKWRCLMVRERAPSRQCAFRGVRILFTARKSSNSMVGCPV